MTTAEWIMSALGAIGVLITAAGWFISVGRQGQKIATLEGQVADVGAAVNLRATIADLVLLTKRTDGLEKDVKEVGEIKLQLRSHAELTTARFDAIGQQIRAGFDQVAGEQRSFDRLVTSQLEEIKRRLGVSAAN